MVHNLGQPGGTENEKQFEIVTKLDGTTTPTSYYVFYVVVPVCLMLCGGLVMPVEGDVEFSSSD